MKHIAWATDLHLNFATQSSLDAVLQQVRAANPAAFLIGGDIGEADSFEHFLCEIAQHIECPVYFVLGNNDYYRSSIAAARAKCEAIQNLSPRLNWLPAAGVVPLSPTTALVGHGGWGDGRAADFLASDVVLNDYLLIKDLKQTIVEDADADTPDFRADGILTPELLAQLNALGDEAARHFQQVVPQALATHNHVIVLMHVPPFREACWHDGQISDDQWAPHFVCQAAGEALAKLMQAHPQQHMTVLCGHTHGAGTAQILPNLQVLTGGAQYGSPALQEMLEIPD